MVGERLAESNTRKLPDGIKTGRQLSDLVIVPGLNLREFPWFTVNRREISVRFLVVDEAALVIVPV